MDKAEFLTIFGTFEKLDAVTRTLPSVIDETKRHNARLIVHDSSVTGRNEKWPFLMELNKNHDFFLILSDNLSMAHARNMCLSLGQALYAPDIICILEDDHGFHEGFIPAMTDSIKQYYGKMAPNGLRYGLFTGCAKHCRSTLHPLESGHAYPDANAPPKLLGGVNSCLRCAPTSHWINVLKGYDTDEYLISSFQTRNVNLRNYHKGFTSLIIDNGARVFDVETAGRGASARSAVKLWDSIYTASDARSRYAGKARNDPSQGGLIQRAVTKIFGGPT